MHEFSFINNIIEDIPDKDDVMGILIEVGDLAEIEADHLKEHLEEITGWEVEIEHKESLIRCDCGYEGIARIKQRVHDILVFCCPECDEVPEVLEGKDIKILKVRYK